MMPSERDRLERIHNDALTELAAAVKLAKEANKRLRLARVLQAASHKALMASMGTLPKAPRYAYDDTAE